jgi:sugar-specific transcriptional regulator TrmB
VLLQKTLSKPLSPLQTLSHSGLCGTSLDEVDVLVGLGLTVRQARVYLALLKTGDAKVQDISGASGVNRQEIYRLLDGLLQMGLVQRHVSAPSTFEATPISEAVAMLLERKTSQWNGLCQQAKQLTERLSPSLPVAVDVKPCFGTVIEGDRGKKYIKTLKQTRHTIEIITSWKRFKQLSRLLEMPLNKALSRGVTLRVLTEKPYNHQLPKWVQGALLSSEHFEFRLQLQSPPAVVTIFDQATVAIAFSPETSLARGPELWSVNPALTKPCQGYFDANWAKATDQTALPSLSP